MSDEAIKLKLDYVKSEIETRKVQLRELKLSYDIAKNRLAHVERTLRTLEDELDLLSQGQLPLNYHDDTVDI